MLQENYILRGNCESFLGSIVLSFEGLFPLAVQWSIKLRSLPYYTHPLINFTSCKTMTRRYDKKFQEKMHNRFWQCHIVNLITFNIDIVFGFSFCSRDRTHRAHRGRLDGDVWWFRRYVFTQDNIFWNRAFFSGTKFPKPKFSKNRQKSWNRNATHWTEVVWMETLDPNRYVFYSRTAAWR